MPIYVTGVFKVDNAKVEVLESNSVETQKKYANLFGTFTYIHPSSCEARGSKFLPFTFEWSIWVKVISNGSYQESNGWKV